MTEIRTESRSRQSFRLNTRAVAMQIIDGEAILIHFERGFYFNARGFGCEILRHLERGFELTDVVDLLTRRSGATRSAVLDAVTRYLALLATEDLIVREAADVAPIEDSSTEPVVFDEPELVKHTDLEELLLIDPIHDVDAAGWPPPATPTEPRDGVEP